MPSKNFTSDDKRFTLQLPPNWDEYDDGEENTYAFFNNVKWTGNLRITHFNWPGSNGNSEGKAEKFIEEDLAENAGSSKIILGNWICAHYTKNLTQQNDDLIIYYWSTGILNDLFICSFTIDKAQENTDENTLELKKVQEIISSLKLS